MNSIIGFTITKGLLPASFSRADMASQQALASYKHLSRKSITVGATHLELWGHNHLEERLHYMPDGSLLMLINFHNGGILLPEAAEQLLKQPTLQSFELPWDGRVLLLHISPDGQTWTMWNDWIGSIPVFHAEVESGRIASTLEPVTAAAAGYSPDDFFLPGLISLLINGHYISDWTLYKGMRIIPPDSFMTWDETGFRAAKFWTVKPSQDRWEVGWDDLVDEMYVLSKKAIADTLRTQSEWVLPLSSGLDSRLIAGVAADMGANVHAYAWGDPDSTDVNYSRQVARTLGIPWKYVELKKEYLEEYTPRWASQFGCAMPFHGMYQMCFFDTLQYHPGTPVLSGFFGDVIAGDGLEDAISSQQRSTEPEITTEWYLHWRADKLRTALKIPYKEAFEANRFEINKMVDELPGAFYQQMILLEAWNRQRLFTSFQTILKDYWRGVATPFLNREYARFCLSLPRAVMDGRRLLAEVFRRYYGRLAVIPGTYAGEPYILTGKYLLLRRIAEILPSRYRYGPLRGFGNVQLRTDVTSLQAAGFKALWPLFEAREDLAHWFDIDVLEQDFQALMRSKEDISPLRRLQAVQTLAWALKRERFVPQ